MARPGIMDAQVSLDAGINPSKIGGIGAWGRSSVFGQTLYSRSTASKASDGGRGTRDQPFATVARAKQIAIANQGDVVLLGPGHAESCLTAGGLNFDKAGIRYVGVGSENARPRFTVGGVVGAQIIVSANDCEFENIVFDFTGLDNITVAMSITGARSIFRYCRFITASASAQAAKCLSLAAGASRTRFENCQFIGTSDAGTASQLELTGACTDVRIINSEFVGNCGTGNIAAAAAATGLLVDNSFFHQYHATAFNLGVSGVAVQGWFRNCDFSINQNAVVPYGALTSTLLKFWGCLVNEGEIAGTALKAIEFGTATA